MNATERNERAAQDGTARLDRGRIYVCLLGLYGCWMATHLGLTDTPVHLRVDGGFFFGLKPVPLVA